VSQTIYPIPSIFLEYISEPSDTVIYSVSGSCSVPPNTWGKDCFRINILSINPIPAKIRVKATAYNNAIAGIYLNGSGICSSTAAPIYGSTDVACDMDVRPGDVIVIKGFNDSNYYNGSIYGVEIRGTKRNLGSSASISFSGLLIG